MENNKNNPNQKQKRWNHRKTIVALSVALGAAGLTAIVAPVLVSVLKKGGGGVTPGPTPASVITITFNPGEHGTITDESIRYMLSGSKYSSISSPAINTQEGYVFAGWMKPDGTRIDGKDVITSDLTLTAKYIKQDVKVGVKLEIPDEWAALGVSVSSSYVYVEKGKTWAEAKNSIPTPTDATSYYGDVWTFDYWYLSTDPETKQIDDTYVFNNDVILKPQFSSAYQVQTLDVEFTLLGSQYFAGTPQTTFKIKYRRVDPHKEIHKFKELEFPEIREANKAFSGWYHDAEFNTPWKNDEDITPNLVDLDDGKIHIYAKTIDVYNNPIITFKLDPKETEPSKFVFIGNTTIKAESTSVSFSDVIKPYAFKEIEGTPETGFTSNYYFVRWYTYDSNGDAIDIPQNITNSINIYPEFSLKPSIKFELDDKTSPTLSNPYVIDPNGTWDDVVKPIATSEKEGNVFMGWQTWKTRTTEEGQEELYLQEIPGSYSNVNLNTNKNIVPLFSDSCNRCHFIDKAKISGTASDTTKIKYDGNPIVGTNKTRNINFNSEVNKPVPYPVDGEGERIYTYTFEGNWEYSENYDPADPEKAGTKWDPVDEYYYIKAIDEEAGQTPTNTYFRPVLESTVTITFDANGGELQEWKPDQKIEWIYATTNTSFEEMYKPTAAKDGFHFKCWATKNTAGGTTTYDPVAPNQKFAANTTLYAVWEENKITTTVHYAIKPEDLATAATYPVKISGSTAVLNHGVNETKKFGDMAKAVATKGAHKLDDNHPWQIRIGDSEPYQYKDIDDNYELTPGGDGITVYANFVEDDTFRTITVAESTEYEITSPNRIYIQKGEVFPVDTTTEPGTIGIGIKNIGKKIVGWKDKDGNFLWSDGKDGRKDVKPVTVQGSLENIQPVFVDCEVAVTFDKYYPDCTIEGDWTADPESVPYGTNLKEFIATKQYKPKRDKYSFIGWQMLLGESSGQPVLADIPDDKTITTSLTLVPKFKGESEFAKSDKPYFFDETANEWAQITGFEDSDNLDVYYASEKAAKVSRIGFNNQVEFGTQMTSIPDNFMQGCINWNNAGQKLTIPSSVNKIGKNFLQGCTVFDQEVIWEAQSDQISIGSNFMRDCYSFNNNVTITIPDGYNGQATIGTGFMFECRSFVSTLKFSNIAQILNEYGNQADVTDWDYSLASFDPHAPIRTKGFKFEPGDDGLFNLIPDYDGKALKPYRYVTNRPE